RRSTDESTLLGEGSEFGHISKFYLHVENICSSPVSKAGRNWATGKFRSSAGILGGGDIMVGPRSTNLSISAKDEDKRARRFSVSNYPRNKVVRTSSRPLAAPALSLPLPAGGLPRGVPVTAQEDVRPIQQGAPSVPLTGFPRGFLEEGSRPTTPAGKTPPSSPMYDSHRLHLPNSTEDSPTLNPATS
ncbi:hypothetical protein THAOC_22234, partial [Thalassiosira oceanica]